MDVSGYDFSVEEPVYLGGSCLSVQVINFNQISKMILCLLHFKGVYHDVVKIIITSDSVDAGTYGKRRVETEQLLDVSVHKMSAHFHHFIDTL